MHKESILHFITNYQDSSDFKDFYFSVKKEQAQSLKTKSDGLVSRIMSSIERSPLVDLTRDLVKIPSVNPPGEEMAVADFISSWFEKRGSYLITELEVAPNRPNILVRSGDSYGRNIIFNGHMDVVPAGEGWSFDPFGGEIKGNRMYGRGVADMKGALAAMMIAMDTLNREASDYLKGSITLAAVVDEEKGGFFGSNQVVKNGISADFAIVGEPTGLKVAAAHKGNLTFEITTFGKSAHASMPKNGVNAVLKMCTVISELKKYAEKLETLQPHPLLGLPTFNVGTINGGVKSNVVPQTCSITAERRLVIPETINEVKNEIASILNSVAKSDPELRYELKFLEEVGPSQMMDGKLYLDKVLESLSYIGKREDAQIGFEATCDAYYFNTIAKIPTIILGPGSIKDIHKPDESIEVRELFDAAKLYALIALNLLAKQG
jgi:acetylornithine deacetylase